MNSKDLTKFKCQLEMSSKLVCKWYQRHRTLHSHFLRQNSKCARGTLHMIVSSMYCNTTCYK